MWCEGTYLARGKRSGLQGNKRVTTNGGDLDSGSQLNGRVDLGGTGGGGVLVLLEGVDLGVDGGLVAVDAELADGEGVLLDGAEEDGVDLAVEIAGRLGVGEGLVGDDLLQAVEVGDVGGAGSGRRVAEEGKDGVLDLEGVVELEEGVGGAENGLVRVLLGHLTPHQAGGTHPAPELGDITSAGHAGQAEEGDFVLHVEKGGVCVCESDRRKRYVRLYKTEARPEKNVERNEKVHRTGPKRECTRKSKERELRKKKRHIYQRGRRCLIRA